MRPPIVLLSVLAGVLAVAPGAASPGSPSSLPLHGPEKVAAGPLLGFVFSERGARLAPIDPRTLRPRRSGRSLRLPYLSAWTVSSTGSRIALAVHENPVNEPNLLEAIELPSLRAIGRPIDLGGDVSALAWTGPQRVAALVGKARCCPLPLSVVVVDVGAERVVSRQPLAGTVLSVARSPRGLVLLTAPAAAIGPARVVAIDSADIRSLPLAWITAGWSSRGTDISRVRVPALAVDTRGAHAYVVDPDGVVADVELSAGTVSYHPLTAKARYARRPEVVSSPLAPAKAEEGPLRIALWLGDGVLALSGRATLGTAERFRYEPAGLRVVNVRTWTETVLDPGADAFAVTEGFLLATGVRWEGTTQTAIGLRVFGSDGGERLRLFPGRPVVIERVLAGRAYVGLASVRWRRYRVVDLRSGRVTIGTRLVRGLPEPLLGRGSLPSGP